MEDPLLTADNLRVRRCRHGLMTYLTTDVYIGRSFDLYGEYVEAEMDLLARLVPQGGLAIDVGANIGAHTVVLARAAGPSGLVLAFEPQRALHQILCANVALNRLGNVYTLWEAAGSRTGAILVPRIDYTVADNFGGVSLVGVGGGEQVRLSTIDSLGLPACHLIKIDVEGMEADVLEGARATLDRHRPAVYLETDRPDTYRGLLSWLFAHGYRVWRHTCPLFNPGNHGGNLENVFGHQVAINALALPRERPASIGLPELTHPDDGLDDIRRARGEA